MDEIRRIFCYNITITLNELSLFCAFFVVNCTQIDISSIISSVLCVLFMYFLWISVVQCQVKQDKKHKKMKKLVKAINQNELTTCWPLLKTRHDTTRQLECILKWNIFCLCHVIVTISGCCNTKTNQKVNKCTNYQDKHIYDLLSYPILPLRLKQIIIVVIIYHPTRLVIHKKNEHFHHLYFGNRQHLWNRNCNFSPFSCESCVWNF